MNIYQKFWTSKIATYFLGFVVILFNLYQCNPNPRMDDDILGEQAYWLSKLGYVKSELMRGYNGLGLENYQAVFHKLFIYSGALSISMFGWSVWSLHLVNFFYLLLLLLLLHRYIRHFFSESKELFYGIVILLFLNFEFAYGVGSFRPEILVLLMGFSSFYCLRMYLEKATQPTAYLLAAGLFSGLAMLTHLNGIVFMVAGFVLLVRHKHYGFSILFGALGSSVFLVGYFIDVFQNRDFAYFLAQFQGDPSLTSTDFQWYSPLLKLLQEQVRYLYNEKEIPYTIAIVAVLLFSFKHLKAIMSNELLYTLVLAITMGCFNYSKSPQYLILLAPFLAMILLNGWKELERNARAYQKIIVRLFLALSLCVNIYTLALGVGQNAYAFSNKTLAAQNKQLSDLIPGAHQDCIILAPNNFVFNELPHYKSIQGLNKYVWYRQSHGLKATSYPELLDSARAHQVSYLLLSKGYAHEMELGDQVQLPLNHSVLIDSLDDVYLIKVL